MKESLFHSFVAVVISALAIFLILSAAAVVGGLADG